MKSNRDLIEEEIGALLADVSIRQKEIRAEDEALRVKRAAADELRLRARNSRMALYALDGDMGKTIADADAANEQYLAGLEE